MTPHIESKKEDIAPIVIMPGDPLRAQYIAQNYLTDYKQVNSLRNMLAYTGYYNQKKVTVFASGMGIPSIGIYAYELYKFYDVEKIIRIGTSGTFKKDINIKDLILASSSTSISSFDQLMLNENHDTLEASKELNDVIINTASKLKLELKVGKIMTTDVFDHYVDFDNFISKHPKDDYYATEMEAFGLFALAKKLNRQAACILTVVDSHNTDEALSAYDRQQALDSMIKLSLESITNL